MKTVVNTEVINKRITENFYQHQKLGKRQEEGSRSFSKTRGTKTNGKLNLEYWPPKHERINLLFDAAKCVTVCHNNHRKWFYLPTASHDP